MSMPDPELVEFKPKPNYRLHYEIDIPYIPNRGDWRGLPETHNFYTAFGDSDALVKARMFVKEQEMGGLFNTRFIGVERIIVGRDGVLVERVIPLATQ